MRRVKGGVSGGESTWEHQVMEVVVERATENAVPNLFFTATCFPSEQCVDEMKRHKYFTPVTHVWNSYVEGC